jgi:TonB family protein
MRDSGRHIRRSLLNRSILQLVVLTLVWTTWSSCAHLAAESSGKTHRKVVVMVEPEYPAVLKNGHFEGQVRLEATVQPNGNVSHVEVKGGNPMLSQYASQAVMKWKYAPGSAQTIEEVVFNFNASVR